MIVVKDAKGEEIKEGDIVWLATLWSRSACLEVRRVLKVDSEKGKIRVESIPGLGPNKNIWYDGTMTVYGSNGEYLRVPPTDPRVKPTVGTVSFPERCIIDKELSPRFKNDV